MEDDRKKPLLLVVHGGPGEPVIPFADSLSGLEERFVVCLREQRNAGMSYSGEKDLRIPQFVSDTVEVTKHLLARFNRQKLVLMGFSWGLSWGFLRPPGRRSFIPLLSASANWRTSSSEKDAYDAALERSQTAGDKKSADALKEIGPPLFGQGRHENPDERAAPFCGNTAAIQRKALRCQTISKRFSPPLLHPLGTRSTFFAA